MRHVKLRPGTATNAAALSGLIDTTYSDLKARSAFCVLLFKFRRDVCRRLHALRIRAVDSEPRAGSRPTSHWALSFHAALLHETHSHAGNSHATRYRRAGNRLRAPSSVWHSPLHCFGHSSDSVADHPASRAGCRLLSHVVACDLRSIGGPNLRCAHETPPAWHLRPLSGVRGFRTPETRESTELLVRAPFANVSGAHGVRVPPPIPSTWDAP